MTRPGSERTQTRLRGVTELPKVLGEQRFRAWIGRGKGRRVNLGQYPTCWQAAFAYNVADEALHGRRGPGNAIPESEQPSAQEIRQITSRVRRRLGLEKPAATEKEHPPTVDQRVTLFEITVVGFWRQQVLAHEMEPRRELDVAARRLVEAAHIVFWTRGPGDLTPLEVMEPMLARRLDRTFRRAELTRAVLDDEGDEELRIARWLVLPDDLPGGQGFRDAIGLLYADSLGMAGPEPASTASPPWATVLGVSPPFSAGKIKSAYRARSKAVHPDAGGHPEEFIRLQAAYEEAMRHCMP